MSDTIQSTNMNLPVPIVSVEPGPEYAADVNNCLGLIDSHDHSFGKGVQITPNGLNINTDLNIQVNNLTNIRSTRFFPNTTTIPATSPDIDELYVAGADLYFNDGNNNIVRITQSGGVAGSPGSIAGLVSPASASYSPGTQTFTFQSGANIPANVDGGSFIFRKLTTGSPGITISPPVSLASDYTITLPVSPPGSTSFITMDSSGNLGTGVSLTQGITQGMLAARSTGSTVSAGGVAVSPNVSNFSTSSNAPVTVPTLSVTITTTGRPVQLGFQHGDQNTSNRAYVFVGQGSSTSASPGILVYLNGSTNLGEHNLGSSTSGIQSETFYPVTAFSQLDMTVNGLPGTYTYIVQVAVDNVQAVISLANIQLVAFEI